MATVSRHVNDFIQQLINDRATEDIRGELSPRPEPPPARFPIGSKVTPEALERRKSRRLKGILEDQGMLAEINQ